MHTGGEPLRVITSGLPHLEGHTVLEKRLCRFTCQAVAEARAAAGLSLLPIAAGWRPTYSLRPLDNSFGQRLVAEALRLNVHGRPGQFRRSLLKR